jgi:hypothetical protein
MERQGAEVIAFDIADDVQWDLVPFASREEPREVIEAKKQNIDKLKNGFWLAHRAMHSTARAVYGDIYAVPDAIGPVDVATFGCILLHLRDPFLALASTARLVRKTIVITEPCWHPLQSQPIDFPDFPGRSRNSLFQKIALRLCGLQQWESAVRERENIVKYLVSSPAMVFLPDYQKGGPEDTWWYLGPQVLSHFLGVLGFTKIQLTHHTQKNRGMPVRMFTVVGHRDEAAIATSRLPRAA